jgi:hypothetical protein
MVNGTKNKTRRNLMLDLMEVGETLTPYTYALRMMEALKSNQIDNHEFDWLIYNFEMYCRTEKISTNINFSTLAGL